MNIAEIEIQLGDLVAQPFDNCESHFSCWKSITPQGPR